jgi:hypothetical protein
MCTQERDMEQHVEATVETQTLNAFLRKYGGADEPII